MVGSFFSFPLVLFANKHHILSKYFNGWNVSNLRRVFHWNDISEENKRPGDGEESVQLGATRLSPPPFLIYY